MDIAGGLNALQSSVSLGCASTFLCIVAFATHDLVQLHVRGVMALSDKVIENRRPIQQHTHTT